MAEQYFMRCSDGFHLRPSSLLQLSLVLFMKTHPARLAKLGTGLFLRGDREKKGERENEGVCRCGVDVDHKHPTMGTLMLLLSLLLFHPLILCGVVSTNDRRLVVSLSLSHYLSLVLSRSLALVLSCSLARSLARSLSCCGHKRPTIGSLSRSLSFSLPVAHTPSLSRSLALSLSVVLWTTHVRRLV